MIAYRKNSLAAFVILVAGLTTAWANEPNDSHVALTFEVESTSLGPFVVSGVQRLGGSVLRAFASRKPACAAGISLEGPTGYLPFPGQVRGHKFISFALRQECLSTAQKEFLQGTKGLFDSHRGGGPIPQRYRPQVDPNGPQRLLLYAVTLEDAREMANAYVRFTLEGYHREVDACRERIEEKEQRIATAEERLREVEKLIESSEKALSGLRKEVPYRTQKEAMEAIAELDRMLNAALVDIAGIRARIAAIQERQSQGLTPTENSKLNMMFVEESIALQGAEGRRTMAAKLRANASQSLDLQKTLEVAIVEKEQLPANLARYRRELDGVQASLKRIEDQEPQIADHAVTIYPVEWLHEEGGDSPSLP